jgi:protease I
MARIAFLLGPQFEDSEMQKPFTAVRDAGHETSIIGLQAGERLEGKNGEAAYDTEYAIQDVNSSEFDAVVIPGGASPEHLRMDPQIQSFVRELDEQGKIIAAICHGPQILVSAGLLKGRTLTSFPALKDDMINAGAAFRDLDVVVDNNLITSRVPQDEPAFIRETLHAIDTNFISKTHLH